ncbi:septation protein SepH [Corynebacterium sp. ES2794-CONJ1]|uniref:septation protein SepH n=1 Tax=unclassified Corynebacterium TaxID=2624378 RepID=UPI002167C2E5|nr:MULTISPECIES: septation protein SepH [unclassified Corynebacterium]MCS4490055.1 septation protein SepH [Corynebacterium sp. ES2775-CONJ]MCS4491583.1 septation protein SepH [Corynebacterium sp. ES2715-CONJ3]MCS4531687.1 septation protein SepH [Corynebacterium sp. ES2730-CONJ]MCU9519083.1 septation protein SepH [Corynebacterium sp. ES2794-CONJ1]
MKELFFNESESTPTSLVFTDKETDEQFFLAVTDSLLATVQPSEKIKKELPDNDDKAEKPSRGVDLRTSSPLKMRPREIQDRIRAGATIEEVAELNGVSPSRIEPYAHPIIGERKRLADMAKQAYPVRDDGPAKLTLWEVLATAFAARDMDLSQATWDTYRDAAAQWVVTLTWQSGLVSNIAEWSYLRHSSSPATAVARNGLAADLINPSFSQPVRSLSPVSSLRPAETSQEDLEKTDTFEELSGDELLQHPDGEKPEKRRRKAVTPHWEDVLLGVRTNTKRPRK